MMIFRFKVYFPLNIPRYSDRKNLSLVFNAADSLSVSASVNRWLSTIRHALSVSAWRSTNFNNTGMVPFPFYGNWPNGLGIAACIPFKCTFGIPIECRLTIRYGFGGVISALQKKQIVSPSNSIRVVLSLPHNSHLNVLGSMVFFSS